jgi:hypothetical protein
MLATNRPPPHQKLNLHILEDGASSVQVDIYLTHDYLKFVLKMVKYN